ncbi:MAG: hypothetical protein HDT18_08975 [Oscillibacter sp.]|nr:hypothetical protein [Oscillibacter sp.]
MFGKDKDTPKKQERFVVKESHTIGLCALSVICDTATGVHYLAAGGDAFTLSSLTPLLDENGNVVIEK